MKRVVFFIAIFTALLIGTHALASSTPFVTDDFNALETVFFDLEGYDWAKEPIEHLAGLGIVSGVDFGIYDPARSITRAEYIKLVVTSCSVLNPDAKSEFADIKPSDWHYEYISSANELGIIDIYGTSLGPDVPISREDMCYIGYKALEKTGTLPKCSPSGEFADMDKMAPYAKDAILAMKALGVINGKGDNLFDPKGSATRAESAKIIYNVLNIFTENYSK